MTILVHPTPHGFPPFTSFRAPAAGSFSRGILFAHEAPELQAVAYGAGLLQLHDVHVAPGPASLWVLGCGSKLNDRRGYAGFGPCFHLPGFHFGTGFLSHSHLASGRQKVHIQRVVGGFRLASGIASLALPQKERSEWMTSELFVDATLWGSVSAIFLGGGPAAFGLRRPARPGTTDMIISRISAQNGLISTSC